MAYCCSPYETEVDKLLNGIGLYNIRYLQYKLGMCLHWVELANIFSTNTPCVLDPQHKDSCLQTHRLPLLTTNIGLTDIDKDRGVMREKRKRNILYIMPFYVDYTLALSMKLINQHQINIIRVLYFALYPFNGLLAAHFVVHLVELKRPNTCILHFSEACQIINYQDHRSI